MFGLSIMLWLVTPSQGDSPIDGGPGPNILFILLDDFGVNDLGSSSGSPGLTPNLEKLAAEGVSFTRNYVDSTCLLYTSPSPRDQRGSRMPSSA